jgi:hypothetical protein
MRPVRAITTIVFAAAVAAAVTGSYIAYSTHAAQPPSRRAAPAGRHRPLSTGRRRSMRRRYASS